MEIPIGEVKKRLCELVDRVERGETITILRHGKPTARLAPLQGHGKPWRVQKPELHRYKGVNFEEPILGEI
jgi:prevent-host-death family protein